MAGSYRHITNEDNEFIGTDLIDNLGDAYEALEECYDMIQYLSGGDRGRIHQAWLEGHIRTRHPQVKPEESIHGVGAYWKED